MLVVILESPDHDFTPETAASPAHSLLLATDKDHTSVPIPLTPSTGFDACEPRQGQDES